MTHLTGDLSNRSGPLQLGVVPPSRNAAPMQLQLDAIGRGCNKVIWLSSSVSSVVFLKRSDTSMSLSVVSVGARVWRAELNRLLCGQNRPNWPCPLSSIISESYKMCFIIPLISLLVYQWLSFVLLEPDRHDRPTFLDARLDQSFRHFCSTALRTGRKRCAAHSSVRVESSLGTQSLRVKSSNASRHSATLSKSHRSTETSIRKI